MMKFALLSAAAILSSVFVNPLRAQAVISYPGACAQIYPDANCENHGPANPFDGEYRLNGGSPGNAYAMDRLDSSRCVRRHRSRAYTAHDGRRRPCE